MLHTLFSENVRLYLWSSVSIFTMPVDFVLLSPCVQFGGIFEFNIIRKNLNISEWNCEYNLCQMGTCYVQSNCTWHQISITVESGNIARSFMLHTLFSETVRLYLWSSVSIFTTPVDFVLLSPCVQFGENFEFNIIRKNLNISEWNCEYNLCQMGTCYVSKSSLFDNIAK